MRSGHGDGAAPGCLGSSDAGVSIFDHEAEFGGHADACGCAEEDIRGRFAAADIFRGGDGMEEGGEAGDFDDEVDVGTFRGGTDGAGNAGCLQFLEEFADSGERADAIAAENLAVEGFLAVAECFDGGGIIRGSPVREFRNDGVLCSSALAP